MTKFPQTGAFSKWEGLAEFAMFCFHAIRGDYNDKEARAAFTKRIIEEMWNNCDQNEVSGFIVCCNAYNVEGYCAKTTLECMKLPFDVFCFPGDSEGYFHNKGDGGWINWAMIGNFERKGADVYFHPNEYYKKKWAREKKEEEEEWEHRDDWFHSGTNHTLPY